MIKVSNITFAYGRRRKPVLTDFSLDISGGGIYGLLGRNGAGKSTLLYLIAGLLSPERGTITVGGENPTKRLPATLASTFIVPEEFSLPSISLEQYLNINAGFYPNFSREDLRRNLDTFDLDPKLNLGMLSMGQKKKAFMCFALACNTQLLLLDEPTNGLDIPGKSKFRKFMVSNMTDDRTIIISTHQVRDIDRILDHVIITDSNRVIFDRKVTDILDHLRFLSTDSRELAESALYSQPAVGGADIILPAEGDEYETNLNLETLFEFALNNPEILNAQFTNPAIPTDHE